MLVGGLGYQIGFVSWFSTARPRGPEDVHALYSFLAWLVMALTLAVQAVPYLLFVEPLIGRFIGSSIPPVAGRKPLFVALHVFCTTAILLSAVLPSVDGNYGNQKPYVYVAAESAFVLGWIVGSLYTVVMAMSIEKYNLAHIGLTPALTGTMFMLVGIAGSALVGDWMHRCYTGEPGAGPWDGCDGGTVTTTTTGGGGMITGSYSYDGSSSSGGTASCPCPNAAGTKCNCPFDDNCNIQSACYNPPNAIPSGCKMGCWG